MPLLKKPLRQQARQPQPGVPRLERPSECAVTFRASYAERDGLRLRAEEIGTSVSDYIRDWVAQALPCTVVRRGLLEKNIPVRAAMDADTVTLLRQVGGLLHLIAQKRPELTKEDQKDLFLAKSRLRSLADKIDSNFFERGI